MVSKNEKKSLKNVVFSRLCMVEISGIEPLTSWMPFKRSPSWAIPPRRWVTIQFIRSLSRCQLWYAIHATSDVLEPQFVKGSECHSFGRNLWGYVTDPLALPAELYPHFWTRCILPYWDKVVKRWRGDFYGKRLRNTQHLFKIVGRERTAQALGLNPAFWCFFLREQI